MLSRQRSRDTDIIDPQPLARGNVTTTSVRLAVLIANCKDPRCYHNNMKSYLVTETEYLYGIPILDLT